MAAPVLQCAVLGVVDEAGFDGFFGGDVGVQAALVGGFLFWADSQNTTDGGSDTVSADDEVVLSNDSVLEGDLACIQVDVTALQPTGQHEQRSLFDEVDTYTMVHP